MCTSRSVRLVALVVGMVIPLCAAAALPPPADVPAGPSGVTPPNSGSVVYPPIGVDPPSPDIGISAAGLTIRPDETLTVTGLGLDGASFLVWDGESTTTMASPMQSAEAQSLVAMPPSLARTLYLVWPQKNGQLGHPIRINGPDIWWSHPARAVAGLSGFVRGDFDGNGSVNGLDIPGFKAALADPDGWSAAHPGRDAHAIGDFDGNGVFNGLDIPGFKAALAEGTASEGGQSVFLYGRNLSIDGGGSPPHVYLKGGGADGWLPVLDYGPCHIEALLPDNLAPGDYDLWTHGGHGGVYGWSDKTTLEVVEAPPAEPVATLYVDDFKTPGKSDSYALQGALNTAAQLDRRVVLILAERTYTLTSAVWTPLGFSHGLEIRGAGMGTWDHQADTFSGGTAVTYAIPLNPMLTVRTPFATVSGVTFIMGTDIQLQMGVTVAAHDVRIADCRFVMRDTRPETSDPNDEVNVSMSNLYLNAAGDSQIVVENCEFYTPGRGIQIGPDAPWMHNTWTCPASTDHVRIAGCAFYGTYSGLKSVPDGDEPPMGFRGAHSRGISIYNGKSLVIENNTFGGLDRTGGYVLGRMIRMGNSSTRNLFIANNVGTNTGPHSSAAYMNPNMGEQILFHTHYPYGGLFDVTGAASGSVTVDASNGRHASSSWNTFTDDSHSQILDAEIAANPSHWILFVADGRGRGQYRVVSGLTRYGNPSRVRFNVEPDWRIRPDTTSRIVLTAAYRRNIVYNNVIDGGSKHCREYKTAGILLWYNAFNNLMVDNTILNMNWGGVVIGSCFRNPSGWNEVRGGTFGNFFSWLLDTRPYYFDYFQIYADTFPEHLWYSVGNACRHTTGSGGPGGATAGLFRLLSIDPVYEPYAHNGLMMPVIEGNTFENVWPPVKFTPPISWGVVRRNNFTPSTVTIVRPDCILDPDIVTDE